MSQDLYVWHMDHLPKYPSFSFIATYLYFSFSFFIATYLYLYLYFSFSFFIATYLYLYLYFSFSFFTATS